MNFDAWFKESAALMEANLVEPYVAHGEPLAEPSLKAISAYSLRQSMLEHCTIEVLLENESGGWDKTIAEYQPTTEDDYPGSWELDNGVIVEVVDE